MSDIVSAGSVLLHLWLDYAMDWNMALIPAQGRNKHVATLLESAMLHFIELAHDPYEKWDVISQSRVQSHLLSWMGPRRT